MVENKMKSLDDIVFEHKNKDYGAYRLRNTERAYLTRAFVIGTTIFVLFVLVLYFYNRWQAGAEKKNVGVTVNLEDIKTPEKDDILDIKPETPPPPPPPQQEEVAQIRMVIPEPKKIVVREEPPPAIKETENKAIGLEDKEGKKTGDAAIAHGKPNVVPPAPIAPPAPPDPNKIFDTVEEDASFSKGNVSQFISKYIEYTDKALDNGTGGKIIIKFVVERDGSVTDVKVIGKKLGDGLDEVAVNAIKKTSKMWTPGKMNNQPVRSYFRVPIIFKPPL